MRSLSFAEWLDTVPFRGIAHRLLADIKGIDTDDYCAARDTIALALLSYDSEVVGYHTGERLRGRG